jgi:dTDP-4-amino-4,6-dideoxygalactose transaminase
MHYGGYPCAMDSIIEFARTHGLWVVEDAAHAPGAKWQGIACGGWGDIGCFSFYGNKNLTCAEGGLVVTRTAELAEKIRTLRSHGMSCLTWDRFRGHSSSYDVTDAGFNYRIDDLRASLLDAQLDTLPSMNRARRERAELYSAILGDDPRWIIPFVEYEGLSAYHLFVVVLEDHSSRDRVMQFMKARGIQTSIHYPPVHQFSYYRNLNLQHPDLSITEALGRRLVTLPLYPGLSEQQVRWVCEAFLEALEPAADRQCDPVRDSVVRC